MQTLEQAGVKLPKPIKDWTKEAAADPAVCSVILFGSRATGHALPTSDWDFALVVKDGGMPDSKVLSASWDLSEKHGAVVIDRGDIVAGRGVYATLGNEICLGLLVNGEDYGEGTVKPPKKYTLASQKAFKGLFGTFWDSAIVGLKRLGEFHDHDFQLDNPNMGKAISNAAEYAVKLMCLSQKLPMRKSHNLNEMADSLPAEHEALATRIRDMNGGTKSDHISIYRGVDDDALGDARKHWTECRDRLELAFEMMIDLSEMALPAVNDDLKNSLMGTMTGRVTNRDLNNLDGLYAKHMPTLYRKCAKAHSAWVSRVEREYGLERPSKGVER